MAQILTDMYLLYARAIEQGQKRRSQSGEIVHPSFPDLSSECSEGKA